MLTNPGGVPAVGLTTSPPPTPAVTPPSASVPTGATQVVPVIKAPSTSWWQLGGSDERKQFEKDGSQNHNVRRIAAYGGIIFAVLLYAGGLIAIARILGFFPSHPAFDSDMWHIVVAILITLFTVPTVLLIAILKVTSPAASTEVPASVHELLGKMVEKLVDKVTG